MSKHLVLPVVLVLALSACNPRQDTPPVVEDPTDNQLITEAPLGNYDGGDEIVYFLTEKPDGTDARFEAGFIKDGKLSISAEEPPAELQHRWLDSLPEGVSGLEYSEGAEEAMAVHVSAILIGETGLMITGSTALATASNEDDTTTEFAGLTWTNAYFDASYYLPHNDSHLNQHQFDDYSAFGLDSAGHYGNQELTDFYFDASNYLDTYHPEGGLPHPYLPQLPYAGDEDPEDPEVPAPTQVQAVIASPINGTAFVDEAVTFSAAGSSGEGELTFEWAFGYGAEPLITPEQTATHAYPAAGTYTVTLTVRDDEGKADDTTTSITIMDAEPDLVTHQVLNYEGPESDIGIPIHVPAVGMQPYLVGAINSAGLITVDLTPPVPEDYLLYVSDVLPEGSYDIADARILTGAEGLAFLIDASPPGLVIASNRVDFMTNPAVGPDDALGFYLYANQPVKIAVTSEMSDSFTADVNLESGWNFLAQHYAGDNDQFVTNANPLDFYWFAVTLESEPAPEPVGLTFESPVWNSNPGGAYRPTVRIHLDNGVIDPWNPAYHSPITWQSENPSVASVVNGDIFAHSYGTTTITATYQSFIAELSVNIGSVGVQDSPVGQDSW